MTANVPLDRQFGRFHCDNCNRRWKSSSTWTGTCQKCWDCGSKAYPTGQTRQKPSDFHKSGTPHDEANCCMCKRLGANCKEYQGVVWPREAVSIARHIPAVPTFHSSDVGPAPAVSIARPTSPVATFKSKSCPLDVPQKSFHSLDTKAKDSSGCGCCSSSQWCCLILLLLALIIAGLVTYFVVASH